MAAKVRLAILGINYPPEHTGIAPYTGALARGLSRRGMAVHVHTAQPHYPQWKISDGYRQWVRRDMVDGVKVTRRLHFVPETPQGLRRLVSEITFGSRLMFARLGQPDAIIAVSPALFSTAIGLAATRARHRSAPSIVWVQDLYSLGITETGQAGGVIARVVSWVESRALKRADAVVAIHDRFANYIVDTLGVDRGRVEVVRNWTHLSPPPPVDVADTRARLGWNQDELVILHSGNMGVKQGLENVLAAAREADRRGLNIRFILAGDGGERKKLELAATGIQRLDIIDSFPNDLFQAALASADLLLVNEKPGVSQMAVPSKLTSYFGSGRPVIAATDAEGTTAGEIASSQGGIVVPAGEPIALLDAAIDLGNDPERSLTLGRAGLNYRQGVLSEEAAVANYAEIITRVLARRVASTNKP